MLVRPPQDTFKLELPEVVESRGSEPVVDHCRMRMVLYIHARTDGEATGWAQMGDKDPGDDVGWAQMVPQFFFSG